MRDRDVEVCGLGQIQPAKRLNLTILISFFPLPRLNDLDSEAACRSSPPIAENLAASAAADSPLSSLMKEFVDIIMGKSMKSGIGERVGRGPDVCED